MSGSDYTRPELAAFLGREVPLEGRFTELRRPKRHDTYAFALLNDVQVGEPPQQQYTQHLWIPVAGLIWKALRSEAVATIYEAIPEAPPRVRARGVIVQYVRKQDKSLDYGFNLLHSFALRKVNSTDWVLVEDTFVQIKVRGTTWINKKGRNPAEVAAHPLQFGQQDEVVQMHFFVCRFARTEAGQQALDDHREGKRLEAEALRALHGEIQVCLLENGDEPQ